VYKPEEIFSIGDIIFFSCNWTSEIGIRNTIQHWKGENAVQNSAEIVPMPLLDETLLNDCIHLHMCNNEKIASC
jgi:hypothetical protein